MDNESTHYEKKLMIEVCKYVAVRGEQKKYVIRKSLVTCSSVEKDDV